MTTTPTAPATATAKGPFAKFKALLHGKKDVAPAAEKDSAAKDA